MNDPQCKALSLQMGYSVCHYRFITCTISCACIGLAAGHDLLLLNCIPHNLGLQSVLYQSAASGQSQGVGSINLGQS